MLSFSEVVDIDIEDNGDGTVNIYYTVADAGDYTLSIKFGGQPIPEGFYTFTVSYYTSSISISFPIDYFSLFHSYFYSILLQIRTSYEYKTCSCT